MLLHIDNIVMYARQVEQLWRLLPHVDKRILNFLVTVWQEVHHSWVQRIFESNLYKKMNTMMTVVVHPQGLN